ncbi:MAG: hypothetical protein KI792_12600 [Alphaproteobacteria bacterium]|nr:hypothetical protein [Alphaproteobacteria bacterium SS10]
MKQGKGLAFVIAGILFAVFVGNVTMGAAFKSGFLGDVTEMVVLFGACVSFVIGVLILERMNSADGTDIPNREENQNDRQEVTG